MRLTVRVLEPIPKPLSTAIGCKVRGSALSAKKVLDVLQYASEPFPPPALTTNFSLDFAIKQVLGWILVILGVFLINGCAELGVDSTSDRIPLRVLFDKGKILTYVFTSHRDIEIQWQPETSGQKASNSRRTLSETLTLKMAFEPTDVTAQYTTLKVTCRSAKVRRSGQPRSRVGRLDPVERLTGKTFTVTVDPHGRMTGRESLDALLKDIGEQAFRTHPTQGRIKGPEMISDVIATQWFLWDAIASMDPNGVSVGASWPSRLSIPTPMVMRKARDVRYTLIDINDLENERIATIDSVFTLSKEKAPRSWPIPYSGKFQVSGQFGFLRGYQALSLEGRGQERFNVDRGISLGYEQTYHMDIQAMVPFSMQIMPKVSIDQTLKMELVETK